MRAVAVFFLLLLRASPLSAEDAGVPQLWGDGAPTADADAGMKPGDETPIALAVRTEPARVTFGGQFDVVLEVTRPRGVVVTLPGDWPDDDAVPQSGTPTRSLVELDRGERVREILRIPFLALDLPTVKSPAFQLQIRDHDALDVPALPIAVDPEPLPSPMGPDGGPMDALVLEPAAAVITWPVADARPWIVVALLMGGVVAFLLLRVALRRIPVPSRPPEPLAPPRPAHEIALERLDVLLATGLLARNEVPTFVERLMDEVLRDYVASRFTLPAGSRTTRELVAELLLLRPPGLDIVLVERVLLDADRVKFARASLPPTAADEMAGRVRELILATAQAAPSSAETPDLAEPTLQGRS